MRETGNRFADQMLTENEAERGTERGRPKQRAQITHPVVSFGHVTSVGLSLFSGATGFNILKKLYQVSTYRLFEITFDNARTNGS